MPKTRYMNYDYEHSPFTKSLLAGTFAGILAVCLSLLFNGFYREFGNMNFSMLINVSNLIFSLITFLLLIGLIFNVFVTKMKSGIVIYQVVMVVFFALMCYGVFQIQRTPDAAINLRFQYLVLGITVITGLCAILVIPFFYKRDLL